MSYDARQRYRRAKRDPYRGAVLAPSHPMPPVVCADCGHARLRHSPSGPCMDCMCPDYEEATT